MIGLLSRDVIALSLEILRFYNLSEFSCFKDNMGRFNISGLYFKLLLEEKQFIIFTTTATKKTKHNGRKHI